MDIVEVDNTSEMVSCLTALSIPYEAGGDMVQIKTKTPRQVADRILTECPGVRVITRPGTLEDVFLLLTGRRLRE